MNLAEATPAAGGAELDGYLNSIVARNFFAPGNKPPEVTSSSTQTGYLGRNLEFRVSGRDPDPDDRLSYSFEGEAPEGARIDSESGRFEWTPSELGEYEVAFRLTDNGLPAKSATQTVKINVVEPPPEQEPPPGFDVAGQSFLTGITEISGRMQVWITVRTEGRVLKLQEGDELSIGSIQGTLSQITAEEAQITTGNGRVIVVGLGDSLIENGDAGDV
jgi:hypothetical protein